MGIFKQLLHKLITRLLKNNPEFVRLQEQAQQLNRTSVHSYISVKAAVYPPYVVADSTIADYSYISGGAKISQVSIGKFCSIGPNLLAGHGIHPINGISTSPMFYSTQKQNGFTLSATDKVAERKPISIGNDVFIGANVTILDGISIGDGAVIGAGAVVSKNIPPYAIAVGAPIQIIRYRFDEPTIEQLLRVKWWEFSEDKLGLVESHFFEVETFLSKYPG
jgi:virginiamycin A acetyltransferase